MTTCTPNAAFIARVSLLGVISGYFLPVAAQSLATFATLPAPTVRYVIQATDQLPYLIKSVGGSARWKQIAFANQLPTDGHIAPGQVVQIPVHWMLVEPELEVLKSHGDVRFGALQSKAGLAKSAAGVLKTAPFSAAAKLPPQRVETGDKSTATVKLADGSLVRVLPNSIAEIPKSYKVHLHTQSNAALPASWVDTAVKVLRGAVEVVSGKGMQRVEPMDVRTPVSVLGVRGTQFRVGFDETAQASRHEVLSGNVALDKLNGTAVSGLTQTVIGGYGAVVAQQTQTIDVQTLVPAPQFGSVQYQGCTPFSVSFIPNARATKHLVEVAHEDAFSNLVVSEYSAAQAVSLAALRPQVWHIKLRSVAANGLEGHESQRVIDTAQPKPIDLSGLGLSIADATYRFTVSLPPTQLGAVHGVPTHQTSTHWLMEWSPSADFLKPQTLQPVASENGALRYEMRLTHPTHPLAQAQRQAPAVSYLRLRQLDEAQNTLACGISTVPQELTSALLAQFEWPWIPYLK